MGSATEKSSNFARTCNRFSQFLKERRSLGGDIDIISSPKLEIKNLLYPEMKTETETKTEIETETEKETEKKSLELFPLTRSSKGYSDYIESSKINEESKKTTASMTIIYDGKVVVVDDLKEEMAREIMSLAAKGTVVTSQYVTLAQTSLAQGLYDFPMTRRISLDRFMEKRKERIAVTAPYQSVQPSMASAYHAYPEKYNLMNKLYMQEEEQQLELKL